MLLAVVKSFASLLQQTRNKAVRTQLVQGLLADLLTICQIIACTN